MSKEYSQNKRFKNFIEKSPKLIKYYQELGELHKNKVLVKRTMTDLDVMGRIIYEYT